MTAHLPEAMAAGLIVGTQDLLKDLLAMTAEEEQLSESVQGPLPNRDRKGAGRLDFEQVGLLSSWRDVPARSNSAVPPDSPYSPTMPAFPAPQDLPGAAPLAPQAAESGPLEDGGSESAGGPLPDGRGSESADELLSGLLANLAGNTEPMAHGLGEAPREYVDESDNESVERQAGAFERMLDAIDAELGPPPQVRGAIVQAAASATAGERFVAFDLAGASYALPLECVLETDRVPRWTHVPGMPPHLRGVLNLRGEIVPLVDLRTLFSMGAASTDGRMLVIRDNTSKMSLAFVVDRLMGLASLRSGAIVRWSYPGVLRGVAEAGGRKIGLLDPDRVLAAARGDHPFPKQAIFIHQIEETEQCLER